ncbi:late secretory pathway protein avl9 [Balamuthia mandrillaris]
MEEETTIQHNKEEAEGGGGGGRRRRNTTSHYDDHDHDHGAKSKVVERIVVAGFHHKVGPRVEFLWPPLSPEEEALHPKDEATGLPAPWRQLPFLALPDGVHQQDEDYAFFRLPSLLRSAASTSSSSPSQQQQQQQRSALGKEAEEEGAESYLWGVSCFRQIHVRELKRGSDDYTRPQVQKAVCALTNVPHQGAVWTRLSLVTQAYFEQGDFEHTHLLQEIYDHLNKAFTVSLLDESSLYIGLHLNHFIEAFQRKLLLLFKLMLLERRVIVYGLPVGEVCNFITCLTSLLPTIPISCSSSAAAASSPSSSPPSTSTTLLQREAARQQRRISFGFPYPLFDFPPSARQTTTNVEREEVENTKEEPEENVQEEAHQPQQTKHKTRQHSLFPYINLHQWEVLKQTKGYLAGASNMLFSMPEHTNLDALVLMDQAEVKLRDPALARLITPSVDDKRFIDNILQHVHSYSTGRKMQWEGSEDWVRAQFLAYMESLLCATLHLKLDGSAFVSEWNVDWVKAWMQTTNYKAWRMSIDPAKVMQLAAPQHPSGPVSDILDELSSNVYDLSGRFSNKVTELSEAIGTTTGLKERFVGAKANFLRGWNRWAHFAPSSSSPSAPLPKQQQQQQQPQQKEQRKNNRNEKEEEATSSPLQQQPPESSSLSA